MNISEQDKKTILEMYKLPVNEDFWDMIFDDRAEKTLEKQMKAGRTTYRYTITIDEPARIVSKNESLMFKLKALLDENGIEYEMEEEELD